MHIVVLGGGRVGSAIVRDLTSVAELGVTVVDAVPTAVEALEAAGARGRLADLSDPRTVAEVVSDADLVVGAVPGFLGHRVLEAVLGAGRPAVDISFSAEDPFELDAPAREAGVPCLVDCGVAPGLSNMILGHHEATLDDTTAFRCLVGGLPVEREWPWEYRAPFSPGDVIEEYVRPARLRRGGEDVVLPALSEVELVHFPGLGTLEAFNTDGLRSLLRTSDVPEMVEKTLRYPGHADKVRVLRDAGFFDDTPIRVPSGEARPRDVTGSLLSRAWRFEEGEPDLTVARITVEGRAEGRPVRHTWNLLDYYDPDTGTSSMARTTGYTCTAVVRLVAAGTWSEPGVAPPELLGRREECFTFVLDHLAERGVHLVHREETRD